MGTRSTDQQAAGPPARPPASGTRTARDEALAFLTHQYPDGFAGYLEGRAIDTNKNVVARTFAPTSAALADWAVRQQDHHVYVSVNPRGRAGGARGDVSAVHFLHADVDAAKFDHSLALMLDTVEEFPVAASTIVHSGSGLHVYYRLAAPLTDPADFPAAEDAMRRLGVLWRGLDATFDVARCLRLPGTVNWKHGALCRIAARTTRTTTVAAFTAHLPAPRTYPAHQPPGEGAATRAEVAELLAFVPATLPYGDWLRVLGAVHSLLPEEDGLALVAAWGDTARRAQGQQAIGGNIRKWRSFKRDGTERATGYGTLRWYAREHGYAPPVIAADDPVAPDAPVAPDRPVTPGPGRTYARPDVGPPSPPPGGPPPDPAAQAAPLTGPDLPPLLADFVYHLSPMTTAWPHDWGPLLAVAALSPLLGHIRFDGSLAPNLWFLGLGPPGVGKSASIDLARRVVELTVAGLAEVERAFTPLADRWHVLTSCTPEGLQATLDGADQVLLLAQGEFAGTMQSMGREFQSGLRESLCDLYDGRDLAYRRSRDAVHAERPLVATLAATTFGAFKEHARASDLANGYLSRFLFCLPDAHNHDLGAWRSLQQSRELAARLVGHLALLLPVTEARFDGAQSRGLRDDLARRLGLGDGAVLTYEDDDTERQPAGRVVARALKAATIIAALRPVPRLAGATLYIAGADLELGARLALRGAHYAARAARQIGTVEAERARRRIGVTLRRAPATPAGLLGPARLEPRALKDVLHFMQRSGEIVLHSVEGTADIYQWVGPADPDREEETHAPA